MFIDARNVVADQPIQTDLCIIGTGPAGLAIAQEFLSQTQLHVCLIESGGLEADSATQSLSQAETIGEFFLPHDATRRRQFGGNSNIWAIKMATGQIGVRYTPFDEIDFEKRDWVPYSGWPFGKAHLMPFYERAQQVCQLGPYAYDVEHWENELEQRLPFNGDRIETSFFQFGPRAAFFERYRSEISQSKTVDTYLYANAVELLPNDTVNQVQQLKIKCLNGNEFWVAARYFVVASGGLENARLLLSSNTVQQQGLGNQNDLVGRFFMDHLLVDAGMLTPKDSNLFNTTPLYDLRLVRGSCILGKLVLNAEVMRREQLLHMSTTLFPRPSLRQMDAIVSLKYLAETMLQKQMPKDVAFHSMKTLLGLDYVVKAAYLAVTKRQSLLHNFGRGGWSELPNNQRRFKTFQLFQFIEQAPDPENRVMLSSDKDALGQPKLELHWRCREIDVESVRRGQAILAEECKAAGIGTLDLKRLPDGRPGFGSPAGLAHHMGTTRIHIDPKQGVVDEHCRVHGLANLYMAGSSVFPTGSYANPTLTIVAMSLRLADHLKARLSPSL